ncbi:putative ThiJ/PfpI family transcriptional regulator [Aspergillus bombycis]|uniref:Putative ThiJ/PfpI family transcriptional regulator n=1 Tax=Aspergillus bombycis TaxID=109264 RepID=A0A1F8ACQ4_9EURO|nr:putative ThiJ/PfpI family transcriptional regulator [Aspergillus bombycis]OGM49482.1 putative ThiJ/PfpI family transcriptional regulator [Aspergillus bombycis]
MAPLQLGVVLYDFQLVDVAGPVDILLAGSKTMLSHLNRDKFVPDEMVDQGIDINFHYIAPTMDTISLMNGFKLQPTTTFEECPKLDAILLGGPGPEFWNNIPDSYREFLHRKAEEVQYFFTTCTGGIVAAKAGLLRGKRATTNSEFLDYIKKECPDTTWETARWVIDGKFWTAGGAFAGIDMFEHWLEGRRSDAVTAMARASLAYQPRDINGKEISGEGYRWTI